MIDNPISIPSVSNIIDVELIKIYDGDTATVRIKENNPLVINKPEGRSYYTGEKDIRLRDVAALEIRNFDGLDFKKGGLKVRDLFREKIPLGRVLRLWPTSIEHLNRPICGIWDVSTGLDICHWLRSIPTVFGWSEYLALKRMEPEKEAWKQEIRRSLEELFEYENS